MPTENTRRVRLCAPTRAPLSSSSSATKEQGARGHVRRITPSTELWGDVHRVSRAALQHTFWDERNQSLRAWGWQGCFSLKHKSLRSKTEQKDKSAEKQMRENTNTHPELLARQLHDSSSTLVPCSGVIGAPNLCACSNKLQQDVTLGR